MFQINDIVVYGLHGICRVTDIQPREFAGETKEYYTLKPLTDKRSTYFVPTGEAVAAKKLRPPLTDGEVRELVRSMPRQRAIGVSDEKRRKETYQQIIEGGDCTELIRLVKTLYERKLSQQKAGKRQHLVDERFMKEAEDVLYDEFAYALAIDKGDVVDFIRSELGEAEK